MKRVLLVVSAAFLLAGCQRGLASYVFGPDQKSEKEDVLISVACCHENDGTYALSVPADHIQFCRSVSQANRHNQRIDGVLYLARSVDCGRNQGMIGDQYYQ